MSRPTPGTADLLALLRELPDDEIIVMAETLLERRVQDVTCAPLPEYEKDFENAILDVQVTCGCDGCKKDCHYANHRLGYGSPTIFACGSFLRLLPRRALKHFDFHILYEKFVTQVRGLLMRRAECDPQDMYFGFTKNELAELVARLGKKSP